MTSTAFEDRRPQHTVRAVLALLTTVGVLLGVLAAIAYGNPDVQVVQPVATESAAATLPVDEPEVEPERNLGAFAAGAQMRADAQAAEEAALAAAAAQAEQEAAAQAAADEQAAADAAAAEAHAQEAAAIEFAAALAEQEAAQAAAPASNQPPAPPAVQGDPFDALAQCESGRNPNAYNPAGPYYGAFQFHAGTWSSYAPDMPGLPTDYSYEQQKVVAQRLQAARGWSPWPSCARQLGLM